MFTVRYGLELYFVLHFFNRVKRNEGFWCQSLMNILNSFFNKFANEFYVGVFLITRLKFQCSLRNYVMK